MLAGFSSLLSSVSTQPALLAMGAGLLAGAVTGTALVVTGILPQRPSPLLGVVSCYENGEQLGRVPAGASLLVIGRSADGAWAELYLGAPGADRGWVPAGAVRISAPFEALPVDQCGTAVAIASSGPAESGSPAPSDAVPATVGPTISLLPGQTPTPTPALTPTPFPTPTPRPTPTLKPGQTQPPTPQPTPIPTPPPSLPPPPTINPTPTPFVDHTPPNVGNLTTTGDYYYNNDLGQNSYNLSRPSSGCPQPHSAVISATITDPDDGVAGATLIYWKPNSGIFDVPYQVSMSPVGGSIWQATLNAQDAWTQGQISYAVHATDQHGNTSGDQYYTLSYVLYLDACIV